MKKLRKEKGFTLVELMVVIVIVGILAAVAIPKFMSASDKAKISEVPTVLAAYENAQLAYLAETGKVASAESNLVYDAPSNSQWFTYTHAYDAGTGEATYTSAVKASVTIGSYSGGTTGASTEIAPDGTVTRDAGNFAKELPNWN
jgi:type IV pilus assembly protein PilA